MNQTEDILVKKQETTSKTHPAFYTLITVFFFWGFIGASNGVFIPFCKDYFGLSQAQSQLIDFAFYVAYFTGAVIIYTINNIINKEFLNKIGFRMGIVYGLIFSAIGSIAMIASINANSYIAILISLFVIGLGFSLQQTCANPFAIALGNPSEGAQRLSLAGGINSLGTTIGPIILGVFLSNKENKMFDELTSIEKHSLFASMNWLYVVVTLLFLAAAALFYFSKQIPDFKGDTTFDKAPKANIAIGLIAIGSLVLYGIMFTREFTDGFIKNQKASYFLSEFYSDEAIRNKTFEPVNENFSAHFKKHLAEDPSGFAKYTHELLEKDFINIFANHPKLSSNTKEEVFSKIINKANIDNVVNIYHPDMIGLSINIMVFALLIFVLFWALTSAQKSPEGWGAFRYPQLVLGMLALFTYVGVEVTVQSNLGELLKKGILGDFNDTAVTALISLYWGGLMVGRWASGSTIINVPKSMRNVFTAMISIIAFLVVVGANMLIFNLTGKASQISAMLLLEYSPFILLFIIIYIFGKNKPATTLLYLSLFGIIAMILGLTTSGMISVYSFVAGGIACSIMWPFIFSLATSGLGKYTSQGSAFLIMMILGGGVVSLIQGKLADVINIKASYIVAVLCFAYLAYYAFAVKGILRKQGIEADLIEAEGGH